MQALTRRVDEMEAKNQRTFAKLRRDNDEVSKRFRRQADALVAQVRAQADEQAAAIRDTVGREASASAVIIRKDLALALETGLQSISEAVEENHHRQGRQSIESGSRSTLVVLSELQEQVSRLEHELASKMLDRTSHVDSSHYKLRQIEQHVRETAGAV
eukprot:SAG31_NODE_12128_length_966_cov_0.655133_1_plen_158_part_10